MQADMIEKIQLWEDERSIRRTLSFYARCMDRKDWEGVRSVFTPDAIVRGTAFEGQRDDYLDSLIKWFDQYGNTTHHLGTQWLEISGDVCLASTHCYAYQCSATEDPDVWIGVIYEDELKKQPNGEWLITARTTVPKWGFPDNWGFRDGAETS